MKKFHQLSVISKQLSVKIKKIMILSIMILSISVLFSGCAGYKVNQDGSVDSYGVMRTLTVKREFYESGADKSITVSTDSRFKDIAIGFNEIVDSAANTVAKGIP